MFSLSEMLLSQHATSGANEKLKGQRTRWFKEKVSYSKMYRHYHDSDFDEFVVDRWGDSCTFRVYGTKENGFELCER